VALAEVLRGKGIQFDPRVIEAFGSIARTRLAEISRYYDARASAALSDRTGGAQAAAEVPTSKAVEVDC
jgi:hypothetical protein